MNGESLKVLLVEDDEDDAFFITDLIREGFPQPLPVVDHCLTVDSAIEKLETLGYDIFMFDYRLGQVDGIDLMRLIRSKEITTPIIFLTGQGDHEVAVEAMKAGATDYLTKSKLSVETLRNAIRYALELSREADRRIQAEKLVRKSNEDLKRANLDLQLSMQKLKEAQNHILRSEKLASIGRLAAGVCHEILNPLNIISGYAQAIQMERTEDSELNEDLVSVMEEIHRIEKIISGLLKFSRKGDVELKNSDINKELDSVLTILEKDMVLDSITVHRQFQESIPNVELDADRMRQVFLNLINNAKHAMQGGGKLTVTTETIKKKNVLDPSGSNNGQNGKEMPYLRVVFSDTGVGINDEDMGKIFDPFFTTKPEDQGTGLGLSVCYTIVEKHGGTLEVKSEVGKGSDFIIELPIKSLN